MKSIGNPKMSGLLLAVLTSLVFLSGCGQDTTIPADGAITLFPAGHSYSIAAPTCFDTLVTVLFADKTPMNEAELIISGPFADPRQGAGARYTFYDGPCTYPMDPTKQRVSGFSAVTDLHGTYKFSMVVTNPSVTFKDNVQVRSGAIGAVQEINIE